MFQTWKVGINKKSLFSNDALRNIENFLIKAKTATTQGRQQQQQIAPDNVSGQKTSLLDDIDNLANIFKSLLRITPDDSTREHFEALKNLRREIVKPNFPDIQVPIVHDAIKQMAKTEMDKLKEKQVRNPSQMAGNAQAILQNFIPSLVPPNPNPVPLNHGNIFGGVLNMNQQPYPQQQQQSLQPFMNNNNLALLLQNLPAFQQNANIPQQQIPQPPVQNNQFASLFSSLQNQGFVNSPTIPNNMNINDNNNSMFLENIMKSNPQFLLNNTNNDNMPISAIMKTNLTQDSLLLTNTEKLTSEFIHLLYDDMPNKCSTCGKRFKDSNSGSLEKKNHLDWHFRVNKRIRNENIIQSKNWYLDEENWISFRDFEVLGITGDNNDSNNNTVNNNNKSNNNNKNDNNIDNNMMNMINGIAPMGQINNNNSSSSTTIDYSNKIVILPKNAKSLTKTCSICKEKIVANWNLDYDDWVWANAVNTNGKIYHASCYYDTLKNDSSSINKINKINNNNNNNNNDNDNDNNNKNISSSNSNDNVINNDKENENGENDENLKDYSNDETTTTNNNINIKNENENGNENSLIDTTAIKNILNNAVFKPKISESKTIETSNSNNNENQLLNINSYNLSDIIASAKRKAEEIEEENDDNVSVKKEKKV